MSDTWPRDLLNSDLHTSVLFELLRANEMNMIMKDIFVDAEVGRSPVLHSIDVLQ
jgi:hypothetical protein